MKLAALAERLGCELRGDGEIEIRAVRGLEDAGPGDLTFLANPKYAGQVAATRASAVILARTADDVPLASLRSDNPYLAFAEALGLFYVPRRPPAGIHPTAVVAASASTRRPAATPDMGERVAHGPRLGQPRTTAPLRVEAPAGVSGRGGATSWCVRADGGSPRRAP